MYSIFAYEDDSGYIVLYKGSSLPDRYPVEEATLSEALNASPVLTFSIYDGHPALAALLRLIGAPGVYENSPTIVAHNESADDEKVFTGRIYSHQFDDVTGKHTFVCEGLLSRLNDYPVAPYSYSGTVAGYLQALFDHSEAAMTVGNVTVADANDYITRASETPVNLWDEIADKCIGSSLGGYIEIRDGYIVDWLAAPSASTATQDIEKGINLLGLDVEEQPRAKFSGVLVYGAEAGWENKYGQTMYYNLYQYHDWESSLPDGYTMGSYILWNDALREEIGDRVEILHYPDITQPLNLMRRAVSFLQNQADVQTIQVSAIDMVDAGYGEGIDNIKCGQVIHITGKTVDADRMVTAITRDLLDPSNTTFEFGAPDAISSSSGAGGSGANSGASSQYFWHTPDPVYTDAVLSGVSTEPLEDIISDIGSNARIASGAFYLRHYEQSDSSLAMLHAKNIGLQTTGGGIVNIADHNISLTAAHQGNSYTANPEVQLYGGSTVNYAQLSAYDPRLLAIDGANRARMHLLANGSIGVETSTDYGATWGTTWNFDSTMPTKLATITSTPNEMQITSANGLRRLCLSSANNVRVDTRASTSDAFETLYYAATAPITETKIANIITQSSTQSAANLVTAATYYKHGAVVMLQFKINVLAARAAGDYISLGTIVSGKRPYLLACGGSDRFDGYISDETGNCGFYVRTACTANSSYKVSFTYLIQ